MLVLVGSSASGKTYIANHLISHYGYRKLVTATTRARRPGERDGVDYHFLTKDEFLARKAAGLFLETASYQGNFYGSPVPEDGREVVVILEPSGANACYRKLGARVVIGLITASRPVREQRMIARGDRPESIAARLAADDAHFAPERLTHLDFIVENETQSLATVSAEVDKLYKTRLSGACQHERD